MRWIEPQNIEVREQFASSAMRPEVMSMISPGNTHVLAIHRDSPALRSMLIALIVAAAVGMFSPAHAQNHGGMGGGQGFHAPAHMHMDGRFDHNRPYYDRGYELHAIPHDAYEVHHRGNDYWYDRGHWYRRHNGVSVVIAAPIGAFVPLLPLYYSTIWWGGVPYYYANDTYYTWDDDEDAYEVVDPPEGLEGGSILPPQNGENLFVYPKNGQSADQQATDRYECHRSAADQTGFDPTNVDSDMSASVLESKRSDYMRAQSACLEARGYSVK
jgi:hypothetical protein